MYMKPTQNNQLSCSLKEFGLSDVQSMVYLALLEIGSSSVLALSKLTQINRITVHKSINDLIELGLVSSAVVGKRRRIFAETPEKLKLIINKEKALIQKKEDHLSRIMNDLFSKVNIVKDQTNAEVTYFEGFKNVREVYDQVLAGKYVYAIVNSTEISKYFPENMGKFINALENGVKIRNLLIYDKHLTDFMKLQETFLGYESKLLPKQTENIGAIDYLVFDKGIAMVEGGRWPKAIVIKNDLFRTVAEHSFNIIWSFL